MAQRRPIVLVNGSPQQQQAGDTIAERGTTAADNASAGDVGEVITGSVAAASAVSLTTVTTVNVTSISLTAGDWDVTGVAAFTLASTTTMGYLSCGINATSATLPTGPGGISTVAGDKTNAGIDITVAPALNIAPVRVNVSSTTTVYLVARAKFATSTCKAYGTIMARRMR
jgi:hypothetical protein